MSSRISDRARRTASILVAALVLGLGAGGVGIGVSGAWFTAPRTVPAEVSGALLSIGEVGHLRDQVSIRVPGVSPMTDPQATTMAMREEVTIRNTGTIPYNWTLSLVAPLAQEPLTADDLSMFRFRLEDLQGVPLSQVSDLSALGAVVQSTDHLHFGENLAAGAETQVVLAMWLDPAADDRFQDRSVSFDVVVNAMQTQTGAPARTPTGMDPVRLVATGAGTGSADLSWSDVRPELAARGFSAAPVYTVERSRTADFAAPSVVYTGTDRAFVDTKGAEAPVVSRHASQLASTSKQDANFSLIGGQVYYWGSIYQADPRSSSAYWFQTGKLTKLQGIPEPVAQMSPGRNHVCALTDSGRVYCAGFNESGQLGDGTTTNRLTSAVLLNDPGNVFAGTRIAQIDAGDGFTCAVAINGVVGCWGSNDDEQIGSAAVDSSSSPVRIATGTTRVVAVSAGGAFACAVYDPAVATSRGSSVACWGDAAFGQLGTAATSDSATPVRIADPAGVLIGAHTVSTSAGTACVLTAATRTTNAACWGRGAWGLLGDGQTSDRPTPQLIEPAASAPARFTQLALGDSVACAANGDAWCWGNNRMGQTGQATLSDAAQKPAAIVDSDRVLTAGQVSTVSAGWTHACATDSKGSVACWGLTHQFQLGQDDTGADGEGRVGTDWRTGVPSVVKLDGTDLDGTGSTTVCAAAAPKLSETECGLIPGAQYFYRISYQTPDVTGWIGPAVTARRD